MWNSGVQTSATFGGVDSSTAPGSRPDRDSRLCWLAMTDRCERTTPVRGRVGHVGDREDRTGHRQGVRDLVAAPPPVAQHGHRAGSPDRPEREHPVGAVVAEQEDVVAGSHAAADQVVRRARDRGQEGPEGDPPGSLHQVVPLRPAEHSGEHVAERGGVRLENQPGVAGVAGGRHLRAPEVGEHGAPGGAGHRPLQTPGRLSWKAATASRRSAVEALIASR
jgi:hypothetical protein